MFEKSAGVKRKGSLVSSGLRLSLMTLLSRVLGLAREMTKAAFLGTGPLADAFNFAFTLPNFFRRLFAENSVSVAFIPTFRAAIEDMRTDEDKKGVQEFIAATLTLVSFLTAAVVTAGVIAAPVLVRLFYKDGAVRVMQETILLTRVMFPYLFVISIAAFFQGILNGENIFSPSGFTPVLFNAIVIGATYLFANRFANPARAMALGVMAGGVMQAAFQLPFVLRTGWRVGFVSVKRCITNPGTRRVVLLILPTIVGMAAYQLNDFVSAALAGRAGTGVYSSIQYSLRLLELILGIFAVSIGTVILPNLSGLARRSEWEAFSGMVLNALKLIALISIPVTAFALISGHEIIALLFKARNFTDESVRMTLAVFRFHIVGLFFIAVNRVLPPAFYAQGNTQLPTAAGLVNFGTNITLACALVAPMRGSGIALALSVASAVNTVCLLIFLRRMRTVRTGAIAYGLFLYAVKIIAFTVVAAIPAFFARLFCVERFAAFARPVRYGAPLLGAGMAFAAIGVGLLFVTKDEIMRTAAQRIARKFKRI